MSTIETFENRVSRLPDYMAKLRACKPVNIGDSANLPDAPAIYAFFEKDEPCYVGRSGGNQKLRKRIKNHQQISHNAASFVYKRTCAKLGLKRSYKAGSGHTRAERMEDPVFVAEFMKQRELLLKMRVRYVEISHPLDQYLFELYATLEYGLDTSGFETH